jgi:hypothetical protein
MHVMLPTLSKATKVVDGSATASSSTGTTHNLYGFRVSREGAKNEKTLRAKGLEGSQKIF